MSSVIDFEKQLNGLLHEAARKLNLQKYTLNMNLDMIRGDGFLSDFYKVSIVDDETNTTYHLAVKRAPTDPKRREEMSIEMAYKNEIGFYSEIYPSLHKFEQAHQVAKPFKSIPGYVTSCSEIGKEVMVLEDITKLGFVLRDKELLLDDEHVKLIFKNYGHYHAISFCLKDQNPQKFDKLTKSLVNIWKESGKKSGFRRLLPKLIEKCFESLDPNEDGAVIEKFQKYRDHAFDIYMESLNYKREYFGILHGDCWSNNMMFKYQDPEKLSNLESINLLDFQLINVSTPVHDLSYFFYTGGSKILFDKLEEYLDIYYDSFSKTARNLSSDPNKLLPRKALSEDWREYSKMGMIMAFLLTKIKLTSKEDSIGMIENIEKPAEKDVDGADAFMAVKYNEELFKERVRDIAIHMHEIGAL